MEFLFTEPQNTTYKISTRVAMLLGENEEQRGCYYEEIKKFYDIRSNLVHGKGDTSPKSVSDNLKPLETVIRKSLLKFIHLNIQFNKSSKNKFGDEEFRKKIVKTLDDSLINRNKLNDLLKNYS